MTMSERLKYLRKYYKLSQTEFAEKLGVSRSHYSNLEYGIANPTPLLINCVVLTFHVNRDWLLGDESQDMLEDSELFISVTEKMKQLEGPYREMAVKQLDLLLELQKKCKS